MTIGIAQRRFIYLMLHGKRLINAYGAYHKAQWA